MQAIIIFAAIGAIGILVQSVLGFAVSLTAIPLLAIFFPVSQMLSAYTLVMFVVVVWLVLGARDHAQWGKVSQFLLGGCLGVPIGAYELRHLPVHVIQVTVSVFTCIFAILFLLRVKVSLQGNPRTRL